MELVSIALGGATRVAALALALKGWSIERLGLYLLGRARLILVGLQLALSWTVIRVFEELSEREAKTRTDLAMRSGEDLDRE